MRPWEDIAATVAPDGTPIKLRRRAHEYVIIAGTYDLMSSEDAASSRDLSRLGCAHLNKSNTPRILIGGLGMGFTAQAALQVLGPKASVEVAELIPAVADWNREIYGELAEHPLSDSRTSLHLGDVRERISKAQNHYDAILLDVDNGPDSLVHVANDALYSRKGLKQAYIALKPGGALGVWSFTDDPPFTKRLRSVGFDAKVHRVTGSRKGRGRYHYIWVARRPARG